MATQSEFENRRRERRRKERIRKKRIRAVILLILFITVIIFATILIRDWITNHDDADTESTSAVSENIVTEDNSAATAENDGNGADLQTAAGYGDAMPLSVTEQLMTKSNIPEPSEENNLLEIISESGEKKHCYLTFDDGPTENITPQVLDTLRKYNVKATFFQVGSLIKANPDMARRVYEEGHLLANHSNSHNYDKLYATEESFRTEIETAEDLIASVSDGEEPFKLIRFPGGSYNAGDHAEEKQMYKKTLQRMGYYYCDWNTLTGDAEGKTKNAEELLEFLKENSVGYNNLIVLMHDASTKQATADALGSVIEYLADQGYTFHRLDDIDYQTTALDTESSPSHDDDDDDSEF